MKSLWKVCTAPLLSGYKTMPATPAGDQMRIALKPYGRPSDRHAIKNVINCNSSSSSNNRIHRQRQILMIAVVAVLPSTPHQLRMHQIQFSVRSPTMTAVATIISLLLSLFVELRLKMDDFIFTLVFFYFILYIYISPLFLSLKTLKWKRKEKINIYLLRKYKKFYFQCYEH